MVCNFPKLYILGGITVRGYVAEVWEIDLWTLKTTQLKSSYEEPDPFAYASCYGEQSAYSDEGYALFIGKGETTSRSPLGLVHSLLVESLRWGHVEGLIRISRSAFAKIGTQVVSIGGEVWGYSSFNSVIITDYNLKTEAVIGQIPSSITNAAFCYLGSSMYIHGGTTTEGYKFRENIPLSSFYRVELNEDCTDCHFACSAGTYLDQGKCKICPGGTYNEVPGASSCMKCPKGTASKSSGSVSLMQCMPCPSGTYAQDEGSEVCKICGVADGCPVGSSTPSTKITVQAGVRSYQPTLYSASTAALNLGSLIVLISLGVLAFALLLVFTSNSQNSAKAFLKLDFYNDRHNRLLDEVIYLRSTSLGGLFSALFLISALAFVLLSGLNFFMDNVEEQKALVPLVSLQEDYSVIDGSFLITTELGSYGGECVSEGSQCHAKFKATYTGIEGQVKAFKCYVVGKSCFIEMSCVDCEVEPEVVVTYELTEVYSYAEYIIVNSTCTSSIPDEYSSVVYTLVPETSKVFRGSIPSKVSFELTSSVVCTQIFVSESPKWPSKETGFHVSPKSSAQKGSESFIYE
jgi:hypothetical protein